ncbi:MAG: D-glycero-beta-D-manno-heptose-7-phosphate kinase [Rickettsiales bacterium]|nr:D-glycero-beta-D-manno-heptose-7-phosphate kinase [Rickettsiales bacterium]
MRETTQDETHLSTLTESVERFGDARVLCIGDIMLDRFVYGSVSRISPEAPIPVISRDSEKRMLGGCGNVARNLVSLGAQACLISVIGDDAIGKQLTALVAEEDKLVPYLITEKDRITTEKTRFVSGTQQLLRCDLETKEAIQADTIKTLKQLIEEELPNYDVVILSDYGKGVLQDTLIEHIIALANKLDKPVFIDPKRKDLSTYKQATLISPNLNELAQASQKEAIKTDAEIVESAAALIKDNQLQHMLVTRGQDGMSMISANGDVTHIQAQAKEVYDVSGAGDTVIATLACAHAVGVSIENAARIANIAAGIVVGRMGTATIHRTDIKTALYTHETVHSQAKILPIDIASDSAESWRHQNLSIGFTNGCFDVLHVGHLQSLRDAKSHCDRLIVGINSDASVKRLKGESRPINNEMDRAMLLAALDCVDMVVIFRDDTPINLIETFKPDVLMKGADYTKETVVGADIVEGYGGRIELLPLRDGYSSTQVIEKVQSSA